MADSLKTEVAIIGGGIVGVCAALHIAQRGHRVTLLEKAFVGSKASGVNFGGCRTNTRALGELPLSLRSQEYWHQLNEYAGHWCDYRVSGHLDVTHSDADLAVLEDWAKAASAYGIKPEMLTQRQLQERFPYLSKKMVGGSFVADNGSANPRLVMPYLALRARNAGAVIIEQSPVKAVDVGPHGFKLHTETGLTVSAEKVIHSTGGYAGRTAATLFGEEYPVEPIIAQMFVSEPIGVKIDPVMDYQFAGRYLYVRQVERGNILVGRGSGVFDFETDRTSFVPVNMFNGSAVASQFIPELEGINIIRCWGGLDGAMPDWMPVIDFSPTIPNLIHAFGGSGHGFQLGPATGAVLAELALDGRTPTDISQLKADRFAKPN